VRSSPSHPNPRGGPSGLTKVAKEARERARLRQWRNDGAAQGRPVISVQETTQGEAHEHRGSKANEMRARRREKGERRGGVHGAEFSGELGWGFGERFPRRGGLPREAEASTGCARERQCSEQDGDTGGELGWPERPTLARSHAGCGGGKPLGLCCCCGGAKEGNGE
jgi:hypothetical protein